MRTLSTSSRTIGRIWIPWSAPSWSMKRWTRRRPMTPPGCPATLALAEPARPRMDAGTAGAGARTSVPRTSPPRTSPRSVAQTGHPGQCLMALDHALLDGVLIGPVVDHVPSAVRDVPCVVGRRALPQPIDELKLEALDLIRRVAGRHPRERLGDGLLPHRRGDQQAVPQGDGVRCRHARRLP